MRVIVSFLFINAATYLSVLSFQKCASNFHSDCSNEIRGENIKICNIYNTSVCQVFNFSYWSSAPLRKHVKEADASFDVSITPFAHYYFPGQEPVSSINVTFSTKNNNAANGFAMFIISEIKNITICRIFDFRNSTGAYKTHESLLTHKVVLFYDRLSCLVESFIFDITLVFRSYPLNEELSYYAFLPDVKSIESTSPCKWKPVIMIFDGSLSQNIVVVKFSQAPSYLNISTFDVILTHVDNGEIDRLIVSANSAVNMLKTAFHYVNRGYYYVTVKPSVASIISCKGGVTKLFFIETSIIDTLTITYICVIALLGIIFIFAIQFLLRWMYKQNSAESQPLILLVYSYDCPHHEVMINSFIKFLENQCNIKTVTIYGDKGNPETWIHDTFSEASIIMVILSDGLYHTIEKFNNPPLVEGHKWRRQLSSTMSFISKEIFYSKSTINHKKFCKVSFSYSKTSLEPKSLRFQPWGNSYVFPRDVNKLLCYIFDTTRKIFCFNFHPFMPGYNPELSLEGISLIKSIEDMKFLVESKLNLKFEKDYLPETNNMYKVNVKNLKQNNDISFSDTSYQTCSKESVDDNCFWDAVINLTDQQYKPSFQESEKCLPTLHSSNLNLAGEDNFWKTYVSLKPHKKINSSYQEPENEKYLSLISERDNDNFWSTVQNNI